VLQSTLQGECAMSEPLSEQSLELFERAQRAIDRSVELRAQTELRMAEARNRVFQLELAMSRLGGTESHGEPGGDRRWAFGRT